jgi:hypothetical protein
MYVCLGVGQRDEVVERALTLHIYIFLLLEYMLVTFCLCVANDRRDEPPQIPTQSVQRVLPAGKS